MEDSDGVAAVMAAIERIDDAVQVALARSAECYPLLPQGHPARALLGEARGALERIRWETSELRGAE